jgi:hypothetical protein
MHIDLQMIEVAQRMEIASLQVARLLQLSSKELNEISQLLTSHLNRRPPISSSSSVVCVAPFCINHERDSIPSGWHTSAQSLVLTAVTAPMSFYKDDDLIKIWGYLFATIITCSIAPATTIIACSIAPATVLERLPDAQSSRLHSSNLKPLQRRIGCGIISKTHLSPRRNCSLDRVLPAP